MVNPTKPKPGPQIRVPNWKLIFWFLNQNICCGYSKEPSQWDGSFEHSKQMFKLADKKTIATLCSKILLNWPYAKHSVIQELHCMFNYDHPQYIFWYKIIKLSSMITVPQLSENLHVWIWTLSTCSPEKVNSLYKIAQDKCGTPNPIFLISQQKHMLWVLIEASRWAASMSTKTYVFIG